MSSQCMKQRRPICVTFPIYREESENNIYDRKGLKVKIEKDPPGQRNDEKNWRKEGNNLKQADTLDGQCFRKKSIEKKAWKGMVRWRKVKEGEDVNNYTKHKDG